MKILFLDLDGVIVTRASLKIHSGLFAPFDPVCVERLNRITDATGAHIVVSSTWRLFFEFDELCELFKNYGVTGKVYGRTPDLRYTAREEEIKAYLSKHPEVRQFAVVDDDRDVVSNAVFTETVYGLQDWHVEELIRLLS